MKGTNKITSSSRFRAITIPEFMPKRDKRFTKIY
jgi:hypothetical protein